MVDQWDRFGKERKVFGKDKERILKVKEITRERGKGEARGKGGKGQYS